MLLCVDLTDLMPEVERAFAVTGSDTPGWEDPHADRAVLEEEYSRCLGPGKYRILGARIEAWVQVLSVRGIAVADDAPTEAWTGAVRDVGGWGRVRRLAPTRSGGLALLFAETLVDGAPFGIDVGLARQVRPPAPVLLDSVPGCGCDACDSGSADVLQVIDEWVLAVGRGGAMHARGGPANVTRTLSGWEARNHGREGWLDESQPAPSDIVRWVGASWAG